jgi:hypothetical protein
LAVNCFFMWKLFQYRKLNVTLEQVLQVKRVRRCIALLLLESWRVMGVGDQRHTPQLYLRERDPLLILRETGWAPYSKQAGAENLAHSSIICIY